MMEYLNDIFAFEEDTLWRVTKVFVVVFLTLLSNFIAARVIARIAKKLEATKNLWDDALVYSLRRPVRLLIWVIGLTIAVDFAYSHEKNTIVAIANSIRDVGVIIAITWFGLRFIRYVEENIFDSNQGEHLKLDRTTVSAIAKLLRVALMITAALITMQTLGFSITGVLAFGGIGGMAVGLAAKDLLANFFGALVIYLDRPFKVGDWVRSPDKSIEGTVEEIGWRITRIRTFDKRPLYVPNSVFSTIIVENPSRMTNRRIYETIGVQYDDMTQVDKITKDIEAMLKAHEEIDTNQTLMVNLNEFADSSVNFFIYTFTKTTDWEKFHVIKQDVLLKIADIVEKNGADIAFPTQTLHIASSPEWAGLEAKK